MPGYLVHDGDILRVDFNMRVNVRVSMISLYYFAIKEVPGVALTDIPALAAALTTNVSVAMNDLMSDASEIVDASIKVIAPNENITDIYRYPIHVEGSVAGDLNPTQVAGLISLRTGRPGGSYRSRKYIPFSVETDNGVTGKPTTDYVARLNVLADAMIAVETITVGADTWTLTPQVYSKTADTTTPIYLSYGETFWASQRRRGFIRSKGA